MVKIADRAGSSLRVGVILFPGKLDLWFRVLVSSRAAGGGELNQRRLLRLAVKR